LSGKTSRKMSWSNAKRSCRFWKRSKTKRSRPTLDKPVNLLIEGDNYHALSVLNYTHQGKIDVIYIDPPYNTGNKSWIYNNDYIEKDDRFRHSKWLSFMSKRLRLAKNLLKDDGIIIVTIDDYEVFYLGVLMREIFGEENQLGVVTVMHNPRGRSDDKHFATSHEYALFYSKNRDLSTTSNLSLSDEQVELFKERDEFSQYRELPLKRTGSNSTPEERPKLCYPIYFNRNTEEISTVISEEGRGDIVEILPLDSQGNQRVWRWGKEKVEREWKTELLVKNVRGSWQIYTKDRIKTGRKPKTVWVDSKYDASSHGTMLLQQILKERKIFAYPKSLWSTLDCLKIACMDNKNDIVLDFFAGSGTTGHAALELNKEDSGNRKFILCTNNENNNGNGGGGVAESVCYPRIEKVMNGYTNLKKQKLDGFGGNLRYYKTAFVPAAPTDDNKTALTQKATEMLCVKEDTFDEVKSSARYKIFRNRARYTGIIFDCQAIDDFKEDIARIDGKFSVYVFSFGGDTFDDEFEDVQNKVKLSPIPEAILRVYRRIFK